MKAEELRDKVRKIMGAKSELTMIEWMKTREGAYHIRLSFRANARQIAKLKPVLKEHYQQELT